MASDASSFISFILLLILIPNIIHALDGYYSYKVDRRRSSRVERYVEYPIKRLAHNYRDDAKISGGGKSNSGLSKAKTIALLGEVPVKVAVPVVSTSTPLPEKTTSPDDDAYSGDNYPKDILNNNSTLLKNNITGQKADPYTYYNSSSVTNETLGKEFWVNMDEDRPDVIVHEMLSNSHRRAVTVKLKFDFPFYGHLIRNISIATGGFLYTGDYIHSWLAATQYIAPLMANFDTNISTESHVKYRDNGTSFTVEWDKVALQDKSQAGNFTFQVTLQSNGDIIFVYKHIPIPVDSIEDSLHPVKVGLSDAYIIDRTVFLVRRKTIYEYHRVNFKNTEIRNWTVIYMTALPTCHSFTSCEKCTTQDSVAFTCQWCPQLSRCSTGFDRNRQDWLHSNCPTTAANHVESCARPQSHFISDAIPKQDSQIHKELPQVATVTASNENGSSFNHTGIMGFILFLLIATGCGLWVLYAYRNPHTQSGQVLIKYRPSQWTLRRGEARYTAASIHM